LRKHIAQSYGLLVVLLGVVIGLASLPSGAHAQQKKADDVSSAAFTVFDMPKMSEQLARVFGAISSGKFAAAEKGLRSLIDQYPERSQNYYLLSTLLATRNQKEQALDMLSRAIDKGFRNSKILQTDDNLKTIRPLPRFKELAERILKENATGDNPNPPKPAPYMVRKNKAIVSAANTAWEPRYGILAGLFKFDIAKMSKGPVQSVKNPTGRILSEWFHQGRAAGNVGDLYDNRDHQHSALRLKDYPQFSFVDYSPAAQKAGIDYGLNDKILFNAVTIGNSSTAMNSGTFWRSHPRLATTFSRTARLLYLQYVQNHLYVYPAVRDYSDKHGDLLLANTPYMVVSQGKSGSDRPFLNAIASILAAFQPEVKDYLKRNSLLMPTVQMILRQGQFTALKESDYLTYKSHPPVFEASNLDLGSMIRGANELQIKNVPPMVQLSLVSQSETKDGVDDFASVRPEILFNTPGAIAKVVRNSALKTTMTVNTDRTKIPKGQSITYQWVVLRGDSNRIKIKPQKKDGSSAEITVDWHTPFPAPDRPDYMTNRVEIGVFASNGANFSAPAFINFLYPPNQARAYGDNGQILSIDHQASRKKQYIDPQIFPRRNWRDDYIYDDRGNLVGWARTRGKKVDDFTRHGAKVLEKDTSGRALKAEKMTYGLEQSKSGKLLVAEQPTGVIVIYEYKDPADRLGSIKSQ